MSLSEILTENALNQFHAWEDAQPDITYEDIDYGSSDYFLTARSYFENDTLCSEISLEAYENATKWLDELNLGDDDGATTPTEAPATTTLGISIEKRLCGSFCGINLHCLFPVCPRCRSYKHNTWRKKCR